MGRLTQILSAMGGLTMGCATCRRPYPEHTSWCPVSGASAAHREALGGMILESCRSCGFTVCSCPAPELPDGWAWDPKVRRGNRLDGRGYVECGNSRWTGFVGNGSGWGYATKVGGMAMEAATAVDVKLARRPEHFEIYVSPKVVERIGWHHQDDGSHYRDDGRAAVFPPSSTCSVWVMRIEGCDQSGYWRSSLEEAMEAADDILAFKIKVVERVGWHHQDDGVHCRDDGLATVFPPSQRNPSWSMRVNGGAPCPFTSLERAMDSADLTLAFGDGHMKPKEPSEPDWVENYEASTLATRLREELKGGPWQMRSFDKGPIRVSSSCEVSRGLTCWTVSVSRYNRKPPDYVVDQVPVIAGLNLDAVPGPHAWVASPRGHGRQAEG